MIVIPDKIQVIGAAWDVRESKEECDKRDSYGLCKFDCSEILYQTETRSAKRKKDAVLTTFVHEWLHAFQFESGIEALDDHNVIVPLSSGIVQLIKQLDKEHGLD